MVSQNTVHPVGEISNELKAANFYVTGYFILIADFNTGSTIPLISKRKLELQKTFADPLSIVQFLSFWECSCASVTLVRR